MKAKTAEFSVVVKMKKEKKKKVDNNYVGIATMWTFGKIFQHFEQTFEGNRMFALSTTDLEEQIFSEKWEKLHKKKQGEVFFWHIVQLQSYFCGTGSWKISKKVPQMDVEKDTSKVSLN